MSTKEQRAQKYGPSVWISKTEAAAIGSESIWSVDQKIKRGIYEARKDPDTGAIRIRRESVENPKNSSEEPPFKPAA